MAGIARFVAWVLTVLIATFLVYWLWNAVLVNALTIVQPIGFWEALGVSLLARLLFGPNVIDEQVIINYIPRQVGKALSSPMRRR